MSTRCETFLTIRRCVVGVVSGLIYNLQLFIYCINVFIYNIGTKIGLPVINLMIISLIASKLFQVFLHEVM